MDIFNSFFEVVMFAVGLVLIGYNLVQMHKFPDWTERDENNGSMILGIIFVAASMTLLLI